MTIPATPPATIAEALANAQRELTDPPRAAWNPHFKTRYADLCTVLQAVRPVLARHGIAIVQSTEMTDDGRVVLYTRLMWQAEEVCSHYPVTPQQNTPQGLGAALTYARRYALAALVGVASDDDDDGTAASEKPAKAAKAREVEPKTAQAADMIERIRAIDDLDELVSIKDAVQAAGPAAQAAWVARGKHLRELAAKKGAQ